MLENDVSRGFGYAQRPIRTKRARNKEVSLPWVNTEIKQGMRERDCLSRNATINRANIIEGRAVL